MKRVLIVDDSTFMRMVIRKTLENNGFKVVGEADNGVNGVEQYQKLQPNIVLMDLTMDGMSGMDALKVIKLLNPNAHVVMLSAMGASYLKNDAFELGANGYLEKPFNEEELVNILNKL